ncbi:MAG: TonB-dependent receptor [Gammaproteobacteria bacterium]|nr:TonB-dependent receptor [Gammaproteobacteria bacterium]
MSASVLLAAGSQILMADQSTPAATGANDLTEVVVLGSRPIAESEAAALRVQRNSDNLIAVAAADAVGRLPDQNIAQAASRVPGVAVERDQGQARYISLRGAPNYWTTLSFDGINVVSPEGRDARYDSVPSAIASQIIVTKAVTPDMPSETISGNVNIVTRSAFDFDGQRISGKAGYGKASLGDRPQYEGSAVFSDRFETGAGEVGVVFSATYFERAMVTDNFETDYERVSQDQRPDNLTRFWAHEAENKLYRLTRKNWSASGRMDWRDGENEVSLRSIYTTFTDDEARDNYRFDLDDRQSDLVAQTAACTPALNATPTTSGYADICIGNTPAKGTVYGIDIRQRSTLRAFEQSIFTNTLEGNHSIGESWTLNWLGNYTESKDDRSVVGEASWESPSTRTLRPTVSYDFTDFNRSRLQLFTTVQLASPTRFQAGTPVTAIDTFTKPLVSLTALDAVDTTTAYTGRLYVTRDGKAFGGDATFKVGVQFDQRTKVVDEKNLVLNTAAQFTTIGVPTDYNQFSLDKAFLGKIPMDYTFRYFDQTKMRAAISAARNSFALAPVPANFYDVREQVLAGYLMGTVKWDWGSAVAGVRVEKLDNRGIANGTVGGTSRLITAEASDTQVFPSLHVNYNLDDSKKLRFSLTSGAARADYDQIRPNVVVNDANLTISGGNPAVKPEQARGADAYFEWYLEPQGYLMAGVFYKDISDVLYRQSRVFNSDSLNSNGIDRSGYLYSGITNGGDGYLKGFEVAAQLQLEPWIGSIGLPEWMGGFGFRATATFNDSEVTKPAVGTVPARKLRLPGTSDEVFNTSLYYEKYNVSLQLSYQRRSLWLDSFADDLADAGDTYWAADDELDFSARYAVNKNFEIFFDATNLLNNPGRRFSEPGNLLTATGVPAGFKSNQTIEWESFGRRYAAGLRFTF